MNLTALALLELALLAGGGLAAHRFVQRVGHGQRPLVVMTSVSAWFVLAGLVPFFAFAALLPPGRAGHPGAGSFETVALNLVPWALLAAPILGGAQAWLATRGPTPPAGRRWRPPDPGH